MSQQENPIVPYCIFCNEHHPEPAGNALYQHIDDHLEDLKTRFKERRALNETNQTIIDCWRCSGGRHRPLTSPDEEDAHAIHFIMLEVAHAKWPGDPVNVPCDFCGTEHARLIEDDLEEHIRLCYNLTFETPMDAQPSPSDLSELPPSSPMESHAEGSQAVGSGDIDTEMEEMAPEEAADIEYGSEEEDYNVLPDDLEPFYASLHQALQSRATNLRNFAQIICNICRRHRVPIARLPELDIHNTLRTTLAPLLARSMFRPPFDDIGTVTPRMVWSQLRGSSMGEALLHNKVRPIQVLCDLGFPINGLMDNSLTVLGAALMLGHIRIVRYLLHPEFQQKYGVDPFRSVCYDNGWWASKTTPISVCVRESHHESLKTILSYETPPHVMRTEEVNRLFLTQRSERLIALFREPYFMNALFIAPRDSPISPVHCAILNSDRAVLAYFLRNRTISNPAIPNLRYYLNLETSDIIENATPLLVAIHRGNADALANLLAHPEVDPTKSNSRSLTPLYYATRTANPILVRMLLQHNVRPRGITAVGTPLHALVEAYKDAKRRQMDVQDPQRFQNLKERLAEIQHLLLDKGVNPDATTGWAGPGLSNRSALQEAESVGYREFLEIVFMHRQAAAAQ
ncbi:hypothetical protein AbraIFM66950_007257 [Aspergillus brasiliensis]|nr:hypothetical protein AbraIFM66950_007257 [Aspergillus brasiliensis]